MDRTIRIAAYVLTALLLAALTLLSIRGILDPTSAAASFGVPVDHPAANLYQAVYRSRNLMIATAGIVFLVAGMWRALAILTTAAITLPLFDIYALKTAGIPVTNVHPITLGALTVVAILLWVRARSMVTTR